MFKRLFRAVFESTFLYGLLGSLRWYRKLHGGRWELWYIDVCHNDVWLSFDADTPEDYRPPCSHGSRVAREDY